MNNREIVRKWWKKNVLDSNAILASWLGEHVFLLFLDFNVEQKPLKGPFLNILFLKEYLLFTYRLLLLKWYFHLYSFLINVTYYIHAYQFYSQIYSISLDFCFCFTGFRTHHLKNNPEYPIFENLILIHFFGLIIIYLQVFKNSIFLQLCSYCFTLDKWLI